MRRFRKWFALPMCLVAVLAAGCATSGRSWDAGKVTAPDGTVRWSHGSIVQSEGTQVVRSTTEKCDAVKDADGKTVGWTNCVEQAVHAASDDSPGAKAGKIAAQVGSSAAIAGGMVGAAAVLRPAITKVTQTGGGASATGSSTATTGASTATTGAVTQTGGGATANSGSLTTGTVTGGSTVSGPNIGQ